MTRSDAELLRASKNGDEAAFAELYQRHRSWVAGLARRYSVDDEDALEVLQEAFTWLIRRLPELELRHQLRSLLYPVVRHLARDLRQRRRREAARQEPIDPGVLAAAGRAEGDDELDALLARLGPLQREILRLRFGDGLALQEIAVALTLPLGTVKSRLHNALAALRKKIDGD